MLPGEEGVDYGKLIHVSCQVMDRAETQIHGPHRA